MGLNVGFIGLGTVGSRMADHVVDVPLVTART